MIVDEILINSSFSRCNGIIYADNFDSSNLFENRINYFAIFSRYHLGWGYG